MLSATAISRKYWQLISAVHVGKEDCGKCVHCCTATAQPQFREETRKSSHPWGEQHYRDSTVDLDTLEPLDNLTTEAIQFCQEVGSKATRVSEIVGQKDKAVYSAIQEGIDKVNNEAVSNAQRIQKWTILPKDFSIVGGEMGPTMKIKRHAILDKYAKDIEAFY